jgi:hypothetical protein
MAHLLSVNVGLPRDVAWQGKDRPHRYLEVADRKPTHGTSAQHRRRRTGGLGWPRRRTPEAGQRQEQSEAGKGQGQQEGRRMTSARAARGRGMSARRAQVRCESVLGAGLAWATELNASTETPLERPLTRPRWWGFEPPNSLPRAARTGAVSINGAVRDGFAQWAAERRSPARANWLRASDPCHATPRRAAVLR